MEERSKRGEWLRPYTWAVLLGLAAFVLIGSVIYPFFDSRLVFSPIIDCIQCAAFLVLFFPGSILFALKVRKRKKPIGNLRIILFTVITVIYALLTMLPLIILRTM